MAINTWFKKAFTQRKVSYSIGFTLIIVYLCSTISVQAMPATSQEELVVVGIQPGPKLWRVSNGEHELWLLGSLSLLPKKMQWDSESVVAILADTQEFIYPPGVDFTINPIKSIFLLPSLIGIKNNPDKKKLIDVLGATRYQRWSELKKKYIGKNGKIEKHRPMFAAAALFDAAIDKAGLESDKHVWRTIEKAIKKNKIKKTYTGISKKIKKARKTIKSFKNAQLDDLSCFDSTLDRLELDIQHMKKRATAWASGDIAKLKALPFEDQNETCGHAIMESALIKEMGLTSVLSTLEAQWLNAAITALENNDVSFAVLPIQEITKSNGALSALKRHGYQIEEPE